MQEPVCYTFTWLVPQRVLMAELGGVASLEDIEQADKVVINMLDAGIAPVHIIVNCSTLTRVPVNLTQVQARMTHLNHANLGKVAAYGVNRYVRLMASAVFSFSKTQLQFAPTPADAITYIRHIDYTVDWHNTPSSA
jgi:hypothetical protein